MRLPFDETQFLDLFGRYNQNVESFVVALWVSTAVIAVFWFRGHRGAPRAMAWLLAIHWIWVGIVYHLVFFTRINPAATLFGIVFLIEGVLLLFVDGRRGISDRPPSKLWRASGVTFIVYGLAYPLLVILTGFDYPRMPAFAVPCPTTLITIGWIIAGPTSGRRLLAVAPLLWSVVASSAAFTFGVVPDFALVAGALILLAWTIFPQSR